LHERVDGSIQTAHRLREQFRTELLSSRQDIIEQIRRPSREAFAKAEETFRRGIVAAADGTVAPVPLLGGTKIQIGVVLVSNRGDVVDLVTRVFETELSSGASTAGEFFSNLLSRAIMLFGERKLLLQHQTEWRLLHGELIPHELRTGATRPEHNLPPTFDLIHRYIDTGKFIAVSEASDDIDILNAAIILDPGQSIVIRSLTSTMTTFLEGDSQTGQAAANFVERDRKRFREFIAAARRLPSC